MLKPLASADGQRSAGGRTFGDPGLPQCLWVRLRLHCLVPIAVVKRLHALHRLHLELKDTPQQETEKKKMKNLPFVIPSPDVSPDVVLPREVCEGRVQVGRENCKLISKPVPNINHEQLSILVKRDHKHHEHLGAKR